MAALDVNLINPFVTSLVNVFSTMVQIEIERKSLSIKNNDIVFGDISALIGLAGSGSGTVIVSFPKIFADKIVSSMLGCEPQTLEKDDIRDGIGEIVNMVAGSAKSNFSDTKYKFNISLPTVVEGKPGETEIVHKKGVPCIVVGFETQEGEKFVLEVSLKSNVE